MYLFTRSGRFAPGVIREAMTFVRAVTEKVHQESGLDVHAFASTMSPDAGTVVWASFVEDLEHLEVANDKLTASDSFAEVVAASGNLLVGPVTDGLAQVVVGAIDPAAPMPAYILVARATAANGHLGAAMAGGVEIAEAATRITGAPTLFMAETTGPYGAFRWGSRFESIGDLERAEAALMNDRSWVELLDRVGPSFEPGADQTIYRGIV